MSRSALLGALAIAVVGCRARLGRDCWVDEDCWSGRCVPVQAPVCSGVKACSLDCEDDEDCERVGSPSDTGGGSRCTPEGYCSVEYPRGMGCY